MDVVSIFGKQRKNKTVQLAQAMFCLSWRGRSGTAGSSNKRLCYSNELDSRTVSAFVGCSVLNLVKIVQGLAHCFLGRRFCLC